jgi:hypothetical protein
MNKRLCLIVYRGPLERSRLAFIIESLFTVYNNVEFIWINPQYESSRISHFNEFIGSYNFKKISIIGHTFFEYRSTKRKLNSLLDKNSNYDLALVGFSAALFANFFNSIKTFWFINGIPEERAMSRNKILSNFISRIQWIIIRIILRADLVITVSTRMNAYVLKNYRDAKVFAAPNCVSLSIFRAKADVIKKRKLFVYSGTAAPWQALELLADIWKNIHELDKSVYFRVISRDQRCRVLANGISVSNIEFTSSDNFNEVAELLNEADVGFLVRRPHIVNEVSFPTKLGEYLASGLWVVCSNIDWDAADYIRKHEVGCLIDPTNDPKSNARKILNEYEKIQLSTEFMYRVSQGSLDLDRFAWVSKLSSEICKHVR